MCLYSLFCAPELFYYAVSKKNTTFRQNTTFLVTNSNEAPMKRSAMKLMVDGAADRRPVVVVAPTRLRQRTAIFNGPPCFHSCFCPPFLF